MQDILAAVQSELGSESLSAISDKLGIGTESTQKAVAAALPALIGGLAKNSQQPEGAQALASALDKNHSDPLTDVLGSLGGGGAGGLGGLVSAFAGGGDNADLGGLVGGLLGGGGNQKALDGAGILGHIFGGKKDRVEQGVAKASGIDLGTIAKLLPILAPIVMSALGTLKKDRNLDAGGLSSMLQGEADQAGGSDFLSRVLDTDGDGEMADDLLKIGGSLVQSGALNGLFS